MFNFLAWLVGSPLRKCENCGEVRHRSQLHRTFGVWFCNRICEAADLDDLNTRAW